LIIPALDEDDFKKSRRARLYSDEFEDLEMMKKVKSRIFKGKNRNTKSKVPQKGDALKLGRLQSIDKGQQMKRVRKLNRTISSNNSELEKKEVGNRSIFDFICKNF
jgi:hypothetical protein